MKLSFNKVITLSLFLLLTLGAFAASDTHKGTLKIGSAIVVNGKQLPAGEYQVRWEGSGPTVEVNIVDAGKIVATISARVVDLNEKSSDNITEVRTGADGNKSLSEVRFSGKKYALAVSQDTVQAQTETKGGSVGK